MCVLTHERRNNQLIGKVRPWINPKEQPYCEPPIIPHNTQMQGGYWPLFTKFLTRILQADTTSEVLSSCSSDIISVGNSLLGVQALVRCVAVESMCKVIPKSESADNVTLEGDQQKLLDHLKVGGYLDAFIKRVKGAIGAMKGVSAKDVLYQLRDAEILEEKHITNWTELRHSRAHGRVVTGRTVEQDLNRSRAVLGLFYRLVFHAVGYVGPSKNYLKPEQPVIKVVSREEMEKELKAAGLDKDLTDVT